MMMAVSTQKMLATWRNGSAFSFDSECTTVAGSSPAVVNKSCRIFIFIFLPKSSVKNDIFS